MAQERDPTISRVFHDVELIAQKYRDVESTGDIEADLEIFNNINRNCNYIIQKNDDSTLVNELCTAVFTWLDRRYQADRRMKTEQFMEDNKNVEA